MQQKIIVKKLCIYNAKIKNIEGKIHDITNLASNTVLNSKINEVKGEIPSITNLAITITEATCVKIATDTKKCSRLKEMSNFNVF